MWQKGLRKSSVDKKCKALPLSGGAGVCVCYPYTNVTPDISYDGTTAKGGGERTAILINGIKQNIYLVSGKKRKL